MEGNMEGKKKDQAEDNMCTAVLTAGIVLSLVCLTNPPALASLFRQSRAWVFVVLNLVLLSIFFTSTRSTIPKNQDCKDHNASTLKIQEKERSKRVSSDSGEFRKSNETEEHNLFGEKKAEDGNKRGQEDGMEPNKLLNEELNERVEAFIATFRQHLVSDERKCRDKNREKVFCKPTQCDSLNSHKDSYSNINITSKQVACSV